jgi:hypothetical protein
VLQYQQDYSTPLLKHLKEETSQNSLDQSQEDHHQPQKVPQLKLNQLKPKLQLNNKRRKNLNQQRKKKKEWIWEDSSIDLCTNYLKFIIIFFSKKLKGYFYFKATIMVTFETFITRI